MTMETILAQARPSAISTHLNPSVAVNSKACDLLSFGNSGVSPTLSRRGGVGVSSGLVYSQTSGTPPPRILIDPVLSRLKKMRTSIITAARLHVESTPKGFRKERAAFITLTYRLDTPWKPNHSSMLIRHVRQWFARRGHKMRFVWVMELHKDGRPHYHLLVWLPKGLTLPKPDKQGWWPHGHTNIQYARNPVGYIAKYASKGEHSGFKFPDGARIHGSGGLTGDSLLEARWWKLPEWAREKVIPADACRRNKGGGLLIPDTGEILETPWRVIFEGGQVYIYRVDGVALCD